MANQAKASYLRVPPRKAKLVVDMVRGKNANDATAILLHTRHKSAKMISKVLKSAIANASQASRVNVDALYVKEICVNPGPIIKRFTPRAMGRGTRVNKRTSHIVVVLGER
ncbi:MAG: 50S ribosomal protein L22 [Pseudomonadota bacterium]